MLARAGYRTGIFGKWHLGDNYPLRAIDQGFQEALVHNGGGIGQPADPPGNRYFDPVLQHNGKAVKTKGYCSDIFTDAALQYIARPSDKPFFVYLAFNCPHTPLQVPERYAAPYRKMNLAHDQFPRIGHPLPGKANQEEIARVYGMVTNIDDNLGRLFAKLEALKLADNTLVIFLTDNGPQQVRYNGGLLQRKTSVHEGGIRVPCFVRWPARLKGGRKVSQIAAHIDIAPTVLEACGVDRPKGVKFDGRSVLPLLRGDKVDWPNRTLYFQWHRGDVPQLNRACAARSSRYKLVQPLGIDGRPLPEKLTFKLYDMLRDPLEMKDIAAEKPEVVAQMRRDYEAWFKDVSSTRGYAPPRIHLGAPQENPTTLTRQDWRGPRAGWGPRSLGHWEVHVARSGRYTITLRFAPLETDGKAHFALAGVTKEQALKKGATRCVLEGVELKQGPGRLEAWLAEEKGTKGVQYVDVKR
jgi:arylsulfatase A-like enzyme